MTAPARQRILDAAAELFYAHGIHATGVDAITSAAGIAKQSFYNNFSSKDALILAFIDARHDEWLDHYRKRTQAATTPSEHVLAIFDAYLDHANDNYTNGFRGCGLLNAAAEFPAGHPARSSVAAHKQEVHKLLQQHLPEGPLHSTIPYMLEGAVMLAGLEGNDAHLRTARAEVAELLKGKS